MIWVNIEKRGNLPYGQGAAESAGTERGSRYSVLY